MMPATCSGLPCGRVRTTPPSRGKGEIMAVAAILLHLDRLETHAVAVGGVAIIAGERPIGAGSKPLFLHHVGNAVGRRLVDVVRIDQPRAFDRLVGQRDAFELRRGQRGDRHQRRLELRMIVPVRHIGDLGIGQDGRTGQCGNRCRSLRRPSSAPRGPSCSLWHEAQRPSGRLRPLWMPASKPPAGRRPFAMRSALA